jgi:hypothetical protein
MRRFLAIPLFLLYLTAVSGVMVQVHYCGQKIQSWKINTSAKSCCCEDETATQHPPKIDNCCNNKTFIVKVIQDQAPINAFPFSFPELQTGVTATFPVIVFQVLSASVSGQSNQANAPPGLWQNMPLYKLHQRFTFYG